MIASPPCHDRAVSSRQADDERIIERLYETHIDQRRVQPLGNLAGRIKERAECKNCQPTAPSRPSERDRRQSLHFSDDWNAGSRAAGYRTADGDDRVVRV